jgi:hypothetical protein
VSWAIFGDILENLRFISVRVAQILGISPTQLKFLKNVQFEFADRLYEITVSERQWEDVPFEAKVLRQDSDCTARGSSSLVNVAFRPRIPGTRAL